MTFRDIPASGACLLNRQEGDTAVVRVFHAELKAKVTHVPELAGETEQRVLRIIADWHRKRRRRPERRFAFSVKSRMATTVRSWLSQRGLAAWRVQRRAFGGVVSPVRVAGTFAVNAAAA